MPRKKGTSNGSIYFDKSKQRWIAQLYYIDSITNQKKKKTKNFETQEEAQKYIDVYNYQKEDVNYIKNKGIPLIDLMRARVKRKLDLNLISENQYYRTEQTLKIIERSYLAQMNIEDITTEQIQNYFNGLTEHYSNSSIKKFLEQFKQAFEYAERKEYLIKNPMVEFIKPKSKKKDRIVRALTLEEQQAFTDCLLDKNIQDYRYRNAFLIQMYMGLRIGEVLAISKENIDLGNKLLYVKRTLTNDKEFEIILGNKTKTYAGNRVLPIPDFLVPVFEEQMKYTNEKLHDLIFSNCDDYVRTSDVNKSLKRIFKEELNVNSENISTHCLRHTYGTRCIEAGMTAVVLQRLMGHKDVTVTLNTYTSVFNRFKEEELEKVNSYLNDNEIELELE